ncbi:MAG TPA: SPFH domain-containing protein [Dongiaceae bacterium]|nr:SPFH domain-containing protein [Dongiaceae bacterium]
MNSENTVTNREMNRERIVKVFSGWVMLPIVVVLLLGAIAVLIYSIVAGANALGHPIWGWFVTSILVEFAAIVMCVGFFALQPNEARVLILFGEYKGTVREPGFHWGNPFYSNGPCQAGATGQSAGGEGTVAVAKLGRATRAFKKMSRLKFSLRARNFNSEILKVNDKRGNPIEIAAVVVWRVQDTAQAAFDVDDYENYVRVQSESAIRHVASAYAYDYGEEHEVTLRSGMDEVSQALRQELQARLSKAGVLAEEARLTHLAYAPEIAQAMLRRQQAEAVIAARQKIVHGAVSMVEMALRELAEKQVVQLDDERRAAMVSNLMVVLCGETEVHPVVNTGTLYT